MSKLTAEKKRENKMNLLVDSFTTMALPEIMRERKIAIALMAVCKDFCIDRKAIAAALLEKWN